MPIEVIVAGLPRTGTTSMRMALEQLGFEKTMHMDCCIDEPQLMTAWQEIYENHLEKTWTGDDWRSFFDKRFPGYVAGVDCPFADFAVEIARAYPNAKVILLHRDPAKWFTSFQRLISNATFSCWTVFCIWPLAGIYALHRLQAPGLTWWQDVYNYPDAGKEIMPFYIEKIKSSIAPERMLVYKVQDGWAPLCQFLETEIPEVDFPVLNDEKSSAEMYKSYKINGLNIWIRWSIQTTMAMMTIGSLIIVSIWWYSLL